MQHVGIRHKPTLLGFRVLLHIFTAPCNGQNSLDEILKLREQLNDVEARNLSHVSDFPDWKSSEGRTETCGTLGPERSTGTWSQPFEGPSRNNFNRLPATEAAIEEHSGHSSSKTKSALVDTVRAVQYKSFRNADFV
ncbi:hypothetical protein V5799_010501 [Amblyomma americanum]|uniref:Secreted protein n=1 Tax=Amblyomma americanum TaxID=6943 RepID=A0AAQ4EJQ9_AMBAM